MSENATPRPKPMPPKKPLTVVSNEKADTASLSTTLKSYNTITFDELQELGAAVYGISPGEMHGEPVVIEKVAEKPKYVLKPHLTERPLKQHEGLMALRKQMEDRKPKRSGQSRTNKEKK